MLQPDYAINNGGMIEFGVGDKVVHWAYGPGEIVDLDEKELSGHKTLYYVLKMGDMTLWVPVSEEAGRQVLRRPTPSGEFEKLFTILASPGEPLSPDRFERKTQLTEQMRTGSLDAICRVIRDLSTYSRGKKLSDNDLSVMERARKFLISEWVISLAVSTTEAEHKLKHLLEIHAA